MKRLKLLTLLLLSSVIVFSQIAKDENNPKQEQFNTPKTYPNILIQELDKTSSLLGIKYFLGYGEIDKLYLPEENPFAKVATIGVEYELPGSQDSYLYRTIPDNEDNGEDEILLINTSKIILNKSVVKLENPKKSERLILHKTSDDYKEKPPSKSLSVSTEKIEPSNTLEVKLHAVFPNPNPGQLLSCKYETSQEGIANILIINTNGQTVLSKDQAVTQGENIFSIDINALAKGTYFININHDDKMTHQSFIVLK